MKFAGSSCISLCLIVGMQFPPALAQRNDVENFDPVLVVKNTKIYKEGTNSIPDSAGIAKSQEMLTPITNFMDYLARTLDTPEKQNDIPAAYKQLRKWAKAGALLQRPETQGKIARVWIATGFGLLILKFKAQGIEITPDVVSWYSQLAATVYDDYREPLEKGGYTGLYSNVYPWVGACEAMSGLLGDDPEAMHAQAVVWNNMLKEVQANGTLKGELARGQRSLEYHIRTADGLLILRSVRRAFGQHDHEVQGAQLRSLLDMIGTCLCNPKIMNQLAGIEQEKTSEALHRIAYGFGTDVLPDTWKNCGPQVKSWGSGEYGGDARTAAEAVAKCAIKR